MVALTRSLVATAMLTVLVVLALPVGAKKDRPDRLVPTPCTVAPRIAANATAVAAATPIAESPAAGEDNPADLPEGELADPGTVAQITAAAQEFAGCFNTGDESRLVALMTDRAVTEGLGLDSFAPSFAEAGSGAAPWEIAWIRLRNVRVLPDGRVSAAVAWGMTDDPQLPPIPESHIEIFARVGDRWLLDGKLSDAAPPDIDPILNRARQGFTEVDSAMYAEPTMAGAKFSIEAMVMVGFIGNDDTSAVSCEMFIFERGDDDVTTSAFCRAEDSLHGRAAYLDVAVSGPHRGNESAVSRCEDAALLAASLVFSCSVDIPEIAP